MFLPIAGSTFTDSGTGTVHGAPIELEVTHTVSGLVTAGGSGVAGAVVWAYRASDSAFVTGVVTGAGGAYSLDLPVDTYKLWITGAPGYPDQAYGGDGTFAGAGIVDLSTTDQPGTDIVLAAGPATHTVSGLVTAGGSGVAGAVVWAYRASDSAFVTGVVTGAGGAYSLDLPVDTYKLWITGAPGYPDQAYGGDGTFAGAGIVDLSTTDQPGTDIVLAAATRHPHRERSRDRGRQRGRGRRGLGLQQASDSAFVTGVVTGAGGAYSLDLPVDTYKLWITGAPGYPDQAYGGDGTFAGAGIVDLSTTDQPGTDIVLAAGPATHTVSGLVTAGGSGVAGAVVWAYRASDSAFVTGVVTGAGGAYSLDLPVDTYKLWITGAPGYPDQAYGGDGTFAGAGIVDLSTTDQPGTDIVLAAGPATHTVSGLVTAGGSGVAGAVVWAYRASDSAFVTGVVTGAGGAYSLDLPVDTYKLWITGAPGYPDQAYGGDGTFAGAGIVDLSTTDQPGTDIVLAAP